MLNWYWVCQDHMPPIIMPSPPAWTVDTRQDASMLSCYLCQIRTLPSQASFLIFNNCPILVGRANCSLSFLFPADRGAAHGVVFCCCSPSALRCHVLYLYVQRCCSAYIGCNNLVISVTVAFLSARTWVCPLSPDLCINKAFSPRELPKP